MLLACMLRAIAMRQPDVNPYFDLNWAWPQKTWFQERRNGLKARDHGTPRKPADSPQNPTAVHTRPNGEKESEES